MRKFLILTVILISNTVFAINERGGKYPSAVAIFSPSVMLQAIPQPKIKSISPPLEKAKSASLPHFPIRPVIDGKLDDQIWEKAAVLKDFYQTDPGDNTRPSRPTEVLTGYDAKFLYFAFRAGDEPGAVRANIARRDQVFDDDYVGIYLDTFNDGRRAYALFFNPLGIQQDGIFVEGGGEDYSVDIVMESKGIVTDSGYTVEIAIPFKSLRYEAGKGKVWGLQLYRRIKNANNELDSWMPFDRGNSSVLSQAGHITGLENISTERTIEITPSLTTSETGQRIASPATAVASGLNPIVDNGRFLNKPIEPDIGLTAKFTLTPAITLDFAYNPDFAQVEADATVITANQRFPIFFDEKRPFFLEGIEIFQTPIQAVNTRAIIDPDYAAKLTGRRGRNTFGFLLASDKAPGNFTEEEQANPDNRRFLDKNAFIGILRLKRDIGRESNIGFIGTSYNFIERHNNLAGIDGRFRLNPQTVFSFQVLGTTSRRYFDDFFDTARNSPRYRTGNGIGYLVNYNVSNRNFGYSAGMSGRSRDYRADVGFTFRTNYNLGEFFVRYSTDPNSNGKIISRRIQSYQNVQFDFQGRLQNLEWQPQFSVQLRRQTALGIGFRRSFEKIYEEEFGYIRTPNRAGAFFGNAERAANGKSFFVFGETTPSKKFSGEFRIDLGNNAFDFDFGGGTRFPRVSPAYLAFLAGASTGNQPPLDPGVGNFLDGYIRFVYQPTRALRSSIEYTKSRLVRADTKRTAFDENIFALRTTYQFTRFTFARARIDYSTLASNVRGQFLIGYTPSPGTAFYAGYNNDLSYNGFNPFNGSPEPGFRRNRQTFFIKATYLFRRSF